MVGPHFFLLMYTMPDVFLSLTLVTVLTDQIKIKVKVSRYCFVVIAELKINFPIHADLLCPFKYLMLTSKLTSPTNFPKNAGTMELHVFIPKPKPRLLYSPLSD